MASGGNNLPSQILVIDDDSTVGQSIEGPLSNYNVKVCNSQDLDAANYHFNNQDFDVVFVELEFSQLSGLALIQKFREHIIPGKRATAFVLMSGKTRPLADDNLMKELLDLQVIVKPFSLIQILPYLSRGLSIKQKLLKVELFRNNLLKLVAQSKPGEALELTKKNLPALGSRGIHLMCEVYEKSFQYQEGLNFISPIADKERNVILYQYLKGRFLKLLGRFDEAKDFLEAAYKSSPHHIKRLEMMGQLYLDVGSPDQAVATMKQLMSLNPENPDLKFDLFKSLADKGYETQAMEFCRSTTKPADVTRYYNNKGVELSKNGDLQGAIDEYKRALKFFPDYPENYRIHYNIALAQIKLKTRDSYGAAILSVKKCLELNPNFEKAQATLISLEKALNGAA